MSELHEMTDSEFESIKDEYDIKSQGHDYYILDSIEKVK